MGLPEGGKGGASLTSPHQLFPGSLGLLPALIQNPCSCTYLVCFPHSEGELCCVTLLSEPEALLSPHTKLSRRCKAMKAKMCSLARAGKLFCWCTRKIGALDLGSNPNSILFYLKYLFNLFLHLSFLLCEMG